MKLLTRYIPKFCEHKGNMSVIVGKSDVLSSNIKFYEMLLQFFLCSYSSLELIDKNNE